MSGSPIKLSSPDQFDPKTMQLVFVHIPKSGGTSFHAALEDMSGGGYLHLVPGQNDPEDINTLWGIGGHFNYESALVQSTKKDRVYVTLLRDPVERFVSFFHHVQARPYHHLAQADPELLEMGPGDFARRLAAIGNREVSNLQCKMVTGRGGITGIKAANHARAQFTICAPLTKQPQIVAWLARAAGAEEAPEVQRLNTSKAKAPVALSDADRAFVEGLNADDMVLFERASAKGWDGFED
jgi:hypothetical protein|tara:strand:- start:1096 stop:1815 length:720 start_codon:yes stop_codon:yes gene_type:complete